MEKVILEIYEFINRAENASHPAVKDWPFVQHISSPLLAICCYVTVVIIGPKIMKTRQAFGLRSFMFFYNFVAVLLSAYTFAKLVINSLRANYRYTCEKVDPSLDNPVQMEIARLVWLFYVSKYFEMLDTVFFILRKKNNQISFLHVYHHSSVLMLCWIAAKWLPGGSSIIPALINSFVHIVMYTYYGLSIFPSLRKYLWWKRYLTQVQMFQFCSLFVHAIVTKRAECGYPYWMPTICLFYNVILLFLFGNFYLQAYIHSKHNMKETKRDGGHVNQPNENNNLKKIS